MELTHQLLCEIWFILLMVLLTGYAILDGFDLGVGILHLAARGDKQRRLLMNSIGPLWDGNEVWLVTFGGALFAAFPNAYATVFSGFYLAFMALLFALIFRGLSIEFRSKSHLPRWRTFWDVCFFSGSTLATFLFGVAVGNAMIGIPIDKDMEFAGTMLDLLGPYPLLVGVFAVTLFAMHGAIYLYLKTEGDLQQRVRGWMGKCFVCFLIIYLLTTVYTLIGVPQATGNFKHMPWAWIVVAINVLAIANIPLTIHRQRPLQTFLSSCITIAAATFLFSIALYPNMVTASTVPQYSLTIYNAASSTKTLTIMLIIALIGMPFVLAYTSVVYWVFRGKVKLSETSY
ncbi:MAG: cytochrome d ubiquinol oxidase subunit II [Planctomycetota bacterium]|jgi:cytochrome d ubiquinol oxidase subunit II